MMNRRLFLARVAGGTAAIALGSRTLSGQDPVPVAVDSANLFAMNQGAVRPVRLPSRPGARASMTADERDALEHDIRCQCGCTLDIYTCRTTDFSCQVSPAMHRDVMALVEGGYDADEIIAAFVNVYGERALMAPTREGFNLVGWTLPFIALLGGAAGLGALIRRWGLRAAAAEAQPRLNVDASPDELARLEAAVRDDE